MTQTAPRIRWQDGNGGLGINGYVGTIESRVFQIWREESRWVLTSGLPGQFTRVTVDEDTDPLKAEAEAWLTDFAAAIGAEFPATAEPAGETSKEG